MPLLLLLSAALASPRWINLCGSWELDLSASGPMDPLLEARGTPWLLRAAINAASVHQEITGCTEQGHTMVVSSVVKSDTVEVKVDNTVRQEPGVDGQNPSRHYWDETGALVSVIDIEVQDGRGTLTIRRWVADEGQTLNQTLTVTRSNGQSDTTLRVFRRQDG